MSEISIKAPKNCNIKEIKRTVTGLDDVFTVTYTYPNGFVITTVFENGCAYVTTSSPLIVNSDGTFTIPE